MPNITVELEDDTPEELLQLRANMEDYEMLLAGVSVLEPEEPEHPAVGTTKFLRDELRRMIKNSELVVAGCKDIIATYKTKVEYIKSDAKVAMSLHQNLIIRLKRVLEYTPAFDYDITIDEEDNKLFFDNTKKR
jgi:hypothetical protein